MLARVIIGFIISIVGFLTVWKSAWMHQNFGSIQWAEEKFGSFGGSRALYKIIGLIMIIVGFLTISNLHKTAFVGSFGWLFPQQQLQVEEYAE